MKKPSKTIAATATVAALAAGGVGIAAASGGSGEAEAIHPPDASGSRLDDGADRLAEATISEQDAIAAAQSAASGPLNEIDLEDYEGSLVFNVDVGSYDVEVDAATGQVLATGQDD